MSNVSIYEKNWTDLVFEDKNKAYGAYQLRQENPRTTLIAFISGVALIFSIIGGWFILSSFGNTPDEEIPKPDRPTVVVVNYPPPPPPPVVPNVTPPPPSSGSTSENKFKNYVPDENPDDTPVIKNTDIIPETNGAGPDKGTAVDVPTGPPSTGTAFVPPTKTDDPVGADELDRLPQYPGTMKKFYEYIGNNFEKPDAEEITSMNVLMSFVIEKDGTMTNIKVIRSSDKILEKEAIRVLKSMKVKWTPGYKDGEKMRTLFTLPIRVAF